MLDACFLGQRISLRAVWIQWLLKNRSQVGHDVKLSILVFVFEQHIILGIRVTDGQSWGIVSILTLSGGGIQLIEHLSS